MVDLLGQMKCKKHCCGIIRIVKKIKQMNHLSLLRVSKSLNHSIFPFHICFKVEKNYILKQQTKIILVVWGWLVSASNKELVSLHRIFIICCAAFTDAHLCQYFGIIIRFLSMKLYVRTHVKVCAEERSWYGVARVRNKMTVHRPDQTRITL